MPGSMLERLKNAIRSEEKPLPRKTTEVRLIDGHDPVERAATHEPALIMLEGDLPGQVFRLRAGRQIIGRRPECDIRVRERAVSGIHAEVIRVRDTVTINDLASTNGTWLNERQLPPHIPERLGDGDRLRVGRFTLTARVEAPAAFEGFGFDLPPLPSDPLQVAARAEPPPVTADPALGDLFSVSFVSGLPRAERQPAPTPVPRDDGRTRGSLMPGGGAHWGMPWPLQVASAGSSQVGTPLPSVSSLLYSCSNTSLPTMSFSLNREAPRFLILTQSRRRSFTSRNANLSMTDPGKSPVSPIVSTFTLRSIWLIVISMCLSSMSTRWLR